MSKSEENAVVAEKVKSSGGNGNKNDTKSLTFKDWKTLKENQCKTKEKAQNGNSYNSKNGNNIRNAGYSDKNNSHNRFKEPTSNIQGVSSFSINNNGHSSFIPMNKFNGVNYYNNNFGGQGNSFQPTNWFKNFNTQNSNFAGNNFTNRFNDSIRLNFTQPRNNFGNVCNRPNGSNISGNINLPENFFSSDGIYRQKDLMQKPLPNNNPFRNEQKASQLLQEFNKSRYTKIDKKKKKEIKNSTKEKKVNTNTNNVVKNSSDIKKLSNEPEVYVPNPKAKIDGKAYIPKPKIPLGNFELSKEEKKQQWKEYRQAIKPFKNRDFHNAKRVVQRLGKKPPSELDEKQLFRLAKSREIVEAHKARLAEKYGPYGNYIKADESSNELGELYVLNKKPVGNDSDYSKALSKRFHNNDGTEIQHFNNLESGRKIIGYKGFKGFVSGGTLNATIKNVGVQ